MTFRSLVPPPPLLSPGCYRVWLSSSLERCPGRRGLWSLVFLDICHLVRKPQAACLVNKKWPLTVPSQATCSRRLTYFPDRVCALISGQGFTAASTSDLNQCRSAQARVAVAGWQRPFASRPGLCLSLKPVLRLWRGMNTHRLTKGL